VAGEDLTEVASAGEGEGGRLGRLYGLHAPDAVRLAYLLTGDPALAEDLVQEAFVRVAGRFADLREPNAFAAYLRRTVVNLARMHFRRRRLERAYQESERGRPRTDSELPDVATRQDMKEALLALPERQRAAVVLRFYEDMSEQQIAEALRCRPGTVKSLLARGIEGLRRRNPEESG
jgi:RNA polymerase sigma-70 factor (sigma-E family)